MEKTMNENRKSKCWKCGGTGYLSCFARIDNGRCWACGATGLLPAGHTLNAKLGVFEFAGLDDAVWQFATISHFADCHARADPKKHKISSILFQCIRGNGRRGRTLLRAIAPVEIGRDLWRAAKRGMAPADMNDEWLASVGFVKGPSNITRDSRGIEWF
jgi:hypothetical protein